MAISWACWIGLGLNGRCALKDCVPWGGVRTPALRLSSPAEATGSFRGELHRNGFMMAQAGQARTPALARHRAAGGRSVLADPRTAQRLALPPYRPAAIEARPGAAGLEGGQAAATARGRTFRNRRTGEVTKVPRGIDPGWAYNPGQAAVEQRAARFFAEKAKAARHDVKH